MAGDANDMGAPAAMASGAPQGRGSTGYGPTSSTNDVQRTGRPDGTLGVNQSDKVGDRDGDGSTTYRGDRSLNSEARTGRPDADMSAPQRSYDRVKDVSMDVTDVSANRIHRSAS